MNVNIANILLDKSIQCRAEIKDETVAEYAELMTDGAIFPPVVLFGDPAKVNEAGGFAYIGDGWHRILAAIEVGFKDIHADVRPGERKDALRFALSANSKNPLGRSMADKQKAVEIALREYGELSSRQLAEICGVSHPTVERIRNQLVNFTSSKRIGADGKARSMPTKRPAETTSDDPDNIPGFREQDASEPSTRTPDDSPAVESIWPDGLPDEAYLRLDAADDAINHLYDLRLNSKQRPLAVQAVNELMGQLNKLAFAWKSGN